jgi:uncharacterized protein YhhL (DUF1145 family)
MTMPREGGANSRPAVDGGRLWAGGLATALVAALVAVAGILLARGVFDVPVLAPKGKGAWGDADTVKYAGFAALAALVAVGLMHLLILFTPRAGMFFGWIVALATLVGVFAPFAIDASTASKVATALINLALGLTIGVLVSQVARSSTRDAARRPGRPPPPWDARPDAR